MFFTHVVSGLWYALEFSYDCLTFASYFVVRGVLESDKTTNVMHIIIDIIVADLTDTAEFA